MICQHLDYDEYFEVCPDCGITDEQVPYCKDCDHINDTDEPCYNCGGKEIVRRPIEESEKV